MRSLKSTTTTTASTVVVTTDSSASSPEAAVVAMQRSPWHSPLPYLFGGLAAMLGLIAFALLILACSYWKLSGQMNGNNGDESVDDEKKENGKVKGRVVYEEQFVVILAGDDMPTCLAMPVCSRAKSCYNGADCSSNKSGDEKTESVKAAEKTQQQQHQVSDEDDDDDSNMTSQSQHSQELHLHMDDEPESSSSS